MSQWHRGYDQGYADARTIGKRPDYPPHHPEWEKGYRAGFSDGCERRRYK